MSRTHRQSEGFGMEDGVYCLKCRRSIKSLLRRKLSNGPVPVYANLARNGSYKAGEAPIFTVNGAPLRYISGRPVTDLLESGIFIKNSAPAESNHG
jgi:hypothetical protein